MASGARDVSGATLSEIGVPGDAPARLSVTPPKTPLTVFVALLIPRPSTVKDAFAAVAVLVKVNPVVSLTIFRSLVRPVPLLSKDRRAPLASVTTLAVTPRVCALVEDAKPLSGLLVLSTVMRTAGAPPHRGVERC